jgi:ABC-type Fe3+/spermidine/putrescine transport system ATPase subunit
MSDGEQNTAFLQISQLGKRFGSRAVVAGVDLVLAKGQSLAVLGPSGCGKSTLLRLIAGLEQADSGSISLNGQALAHVAANRRGIGLVFQDHALFEHLSVFDNVAYGLVEHGVAPAKRRERVMQMLELVQLAAYARQRIGGRSGGERQRIALARTLVLEPLLLLLDEPFASLDERLRDDLRAELRLLCAKLAQTTIFVTHDQRDAFALADQLALMQDGAIKQQGKPQAVFHQPHSAWVAKFLGHHNLLSAAAAGALGLACPAQRVLLIPEEAILLGQGQYATLQRVVFEGQRQRLWLRIAGIELQVTIASRQGIPAPLAVAIDQALCVVLEDTP